jgi:glyoxylase-like metal-dependent hydrolase (beta-lactamase superfamily II)
MPKLVPAILAICLSASALSAQAQLADSLTYTDSLLFRVRALARAVPGDLPRAARFLTFAEEKVPLSYMLMGGRDSLVVVTHPVFQVRYPRGWIMIEAGWNRDVDTTAAGFRPDRFARVQQGLRDARLIVVTHEHADHVGEAIRTKTPEVIAPKTLLNRAQVQTLLDRPNSPLVRLAADRAGQYLVIDYDRVYPIAPGVVLIRAPGHTPGSQMVYVRLSSGRELLFIGDIAWLMAGVERGVQKPEAASRDLSENRESLQRQLDWLSGLTARTGVTLINSHDGAWLRTLVQRGVIKEDLDLRDP